MTDRKPKPGRPPRAARLSRSWTTLDVISLARSPNITEDEARLLSHDVNELENRMAKPVNAIGSTAAEYMVGDINSAILRGVSEGDPKAELMLKIMGGLRPK